VKRDEGGTVNGQVPKGEILVYQPTDGKIKLDVLLERETLWMKQTIWRIGSNVCGRYFPASEGNL
jgi:hypothetical protein